MTDIRDLRSLSVPKVPLHISNSTDPLQEQLEKEYKHTLFSLKTISENRNLFSSIVMLTKNPQILCPEPYLSIISELRPFTVQVSCAFWREEARKFYEPNTPMIKSRLAAIRFLSENGVDVEMRIDPLFPSSRIEKNIRKHYSLTSYGLAEAQTEEDLLSLIKYAKQYNLRSIISKPLKVPISSKAERCKNWFSQLYMDAITGEGRKVYGGSWRLPDDYQEALVSSVARMCKKEGISFRHCMHDVLTRT